MKHLKLFFALFAMLALGVGNAWGAGTWTLVKDASTLAAGDKVIIVAKNSNFAMSTTQNTNNRGQVEVTKNGETLTYATSVQELTLEAGKKSGTFAFYTGNGYLYAASSSKNYLKTETELSDNSSWNITIANTGVATIKAAGTNTRNWLRYNNSNNPPIFSCYGSGQADVCLYKYIEEQSGGDEPVDIIVKTLKSIAVEGMTTNYETGDIFKFDGTCTATYSVTKNDVAQEDETKVVTPTSVSTPDMTMAGEQEVTVTYTENEVTVTDSYTITVTENVITAGEYELALNNTFFGTTAGANVSAFPTSAKQDDITVTLNGGGAKTRTDADCVRMYQNNTLTFSVPEGYVINSIVFTAGGDWKGSITVDAGTYTDDTKSWAGSAQEVVFSFGAQNRIATATVTYAAAGETPDPTPDPEEPEEPEEPVVPEVPKNLGAKTIAEFLELKNTTDTCVLTGVVANIANTTYGNFDLVDATGSVYVYGLLTAAGEGKQFASMNIAAGDTLTVKAIYNEYNGNPQAKNAIYVSHTKAAAPIVPENLGAKTIAEFLEFKNTTDTCVLTGVVANIVNTTYGNFDLVDATGSVYVYGLLTAAGESQKFASMDIAAGDTLTIKAIYNEYNSKPQAKNAIYVSHTKTAAPVVPENLGAKTIAEFLELKNTTDTCVLTGVVANIINTTYGNFDLVDATGTVYVYGLLTAAGESKQFASMDIAAGDTLTVKAIYNEFNSKAQAKNAIYVSHSKLVLTVEVTSENGTVDGLVDGGKYVRGTEVILTATAAEGYEFVNWTSGETEVSTANPFTFTVTSDTTLVANFAVVEPEVIEYVLNGGVLPLVGPTNAELWGTDTADVNGLMHYFNHYYDLKRSAQDISAAASSNPVATFLTGMPDDAGIFVNEESKYKWLGDYIVKVTNDQIAEGKLSVLKAVDTNIKWRYGVQAFFMCLPATDNNYKGWADFTEAGKPENWVNVYPDAKEVELPTEPVEEDYVLPTPTKSGSTFKGWYNNAEGTGEAYKVIPAGWAGTLYAIWKQGTTTALENIAVEGKAVKAIINGQLIIIKNGVQYNAQGAVVK